MPNPGAAVENELRADDPKKLYIMHGEIGHGGFGSVKLGTSRGAQVLSVV